MDSRAAQYHPSAVTGIQVVWTARRWVGVPFRHQGRDERGVDCVGLVIRVCEQRGILSDDFDRAYGRLPQVRLVAEARRICQQIETPEVGCLVLIKWPRERIPAHAALFTGENLIHSYSTVRQVVEHGFRAHWLKWADSFYRLPGVTHG